MISSRRFHEVIISAAIVSSVAAACSEGPAEQLVSAPAAAPAAAPASSPSTHAVSGKAPAAVNGMPSVIVLNPEMPREYPAPADQPYMDQITLTFTPAVL